MGKQLSSVVGPAKWAAVGSLVTALGLGGVYALTRQPAPQTAALPAAPVVVAQREPVLLSQVPEKPAAAGDVRPGPVPPAHESSEASRMEPQVQPVEVEPEVPVAPTPDVNPEPKADPKPAPAAPPPKPTPRFINVNTAGAAELELLPSVGPALAKAIIDYRTKHGAFRSFADLDKVPGIGPKTLEKFKDRVTFR
ncbi:MAG: ComEA family DNA-binding protein [Phycisphaerales bacterium]